MRAYPIDQLFKTAVEQFAATERHDKTALGQFSSLFCGQYALVSKTARTACVGLLTNCQALPEDVIMAICTDDIEIAERYLRHGKALDQEANLALILGSMTIDHLRAIAKRKSVPLTIARQLRQTGDSVVNRSLDLRQVAPSSSELPINDERFVVFAEACQRRDLTVLSELFMARLSISRQSAMALLANKRSANLIVALKYIGMSATDAWAFYRLFAPSLASGDGVESEFASTFASFSDEACRTLVMEWVRGDLADAAHRSQAANDRTLAASKSDHRRSG